MTYSGNLCVHYLELGKSPVSKENFAGEDIRFSNEYETLESELRKAQSMYDNGKTDWQTVRKSSEVILRSLSKDLRVAVWLTWALYQRESFSGLLAGLGLLHHLCQHHWEQLYPRKVRTRAAGINWLLPRLEQVLADSVPIGGQLPLFRRLVEYLEGLDAVLTLHLGDDAPLLLPLRRRLAVMVQRTADNQPEPGVVSAVVAQVKQAATQLFAPGSPIENEKDAQKALREQQERATPLCAWWLRQKVTDLRALRLNRTLLWLSIDALPERNAEQITALRGLPADRLKSYQESFDQGQYADLLIDLETSVARAPFWFDGQRMAWECLQRLNADLAAREVEVQFSLFLQRFPAMVDLRFHDGVPFADDATRSWISASVLSHLQSPEAPDVVEINGHQQPAWEDALQDVLPVLRRDGLKAAVQILKQGLQSAQDGRVRFFWQLSLARLCYQAKKYDLAKAQLESLDKQLQSSGLNAWEPDLALQVLYLLHSCCELLPPSNALRERKEELYHRLCHLDIEVALP